MRTFALLITLSCLGQFLPAQTYFYVYALEIVPEVPTSQDDVFIHVSGAFASTGGYIVSHEVSVSDFTVSLEINSADPGGATVIVPHDTIFSIGQLAAGDYTIEIGGENTGDFVSDEDDYEFTVLLANGLHDQTLSEPEFTLTGEQLFVKFPRNLGQGEVQVMDMQGRIVLSEMAYGQSEVRVGLSDLAEGAYIFRVLNGNEIFWATRFMKTE